MNTSSSCPSEITALDENDKLASVFEKFLIPENTIYLNGNSLGPLTRNAQQRAIDVVDRQWGTDLIASWNTHAWIDLPITSGEKIAKLIGAAPEQVICCDSVSINLLKVLGCCLQLQPDRKVILSQEDNFPSDLYVAQSLEKLLGPTHCKLKTVTEAELEDALNESVAALLLTQVNFRNGDRHDIEKLSKLAKAKGVPVVWDLSHSVGVLPLEMDSWDVDFAIGCGYKYLNGGPGAPAFIYANKKHHGKLRQPIQGWMGHREPFAFDKEFEHATGMAQFLTGTPPIISLAALDSALDVFAELEITDINKKATDLAELFIELWEIDLDLQCLTLESKTDPNLRGAQLAFSHPDAYGICRALNSNGITVDFRSPNIVRLGFSPLFLRFEDIWRATKVLKEIVITKSYLSREFSQRLKVT